MKCDKCGFNVNPGDTVCIGCGSKLSSANQIMEFNKQKEIENKNNKNKVMFLTIIGVIILIIIVFLIIKFLVL